MLNPSFLFRNLTVSLLARSSIMFIHVIVPAKISVKLDCTDIEENVQMTASVIDEILK